MTRFLASSPAFFGGLVILTLTIGLQGCEEVTSPLGQELIKEEEKYHVLTDTISLVETFVTDTNRFISYNQQTLFLGNMQNEFMGTTKASFASTLTFNVTSAEDIFPAEAVVDSAELRITFKPYGPTADQEIQVYKLTERLGDTVYYSDFDMTPYYNPESISTGTTINEDSTLVVALKDEFAEFLFDGEGYLTKVDSFIDYYLAGIYCQINEPRANAGIFEINLSEKINPNKVRLFYHDPTDEKDTTYQYDFELSKGAYHLYTIEHNYEGSTIAEAKNNEETAVDNPFYIQGLGGIKSKFEIKGLDSYTPNDNYAILKAELQMPIVDNYIKDLYTPPAQLYFYSKDENGDYRPIRDQNENSGVFGGQLDDDDNYYSFNITRYITDVLNQKEENKAFYIFPASDYRTPNRVMLNGGETRLIITYTKQ
jgi:hypothetical protein